MAAPRHAHTSTGRPAPLPVAREEPAREPEPAQPAPGNRAERRRRARTKGLGPETDGKLGADGHAPHARAAQGRRINPIRRTG